MRRHLSRAWWVFLLLLLLCALLLTGARLALNNIDRFRPDIQLYLSERLGIELEIGRLEGHWNRAYPVLQVRDVAMRAGNDTGPEGYLALDQITLEFDPFGSLFAGLPVFHRFEISGVVGRWHQRDGSWLHRPGASPQKPDSGMSVSGWQTISRLVLSQPYALIKDVELVLIPHQGRPLVVSPADLELENARLEHRLSGALKMPQLGEQTEIDFILEATDLQQENPLNAHYQGYLNIRQLGPQLAQLIKPEWGLQDAKLDTRAWVEFRQQKLIEAQAEIDVSQLSLDRPWPLPQELSALVSVQPDGVDYQFQINDLEWGSAEHAVRVPKIVLQSPLQAELPQTLNVGITELDLHQLGSWLAQAAPTDSVASRLVTQLAPAGRLHNLVLSKTVDQSWSDLELVADLDQLQVEPWHGAPGLRGVSGRLEAGLSGGRIDLISEGFAMHFPQLYADDWHYQEAKGRVSWTLSESGVLVNSERLQLKDQAVQAAGRFSIDIPFNREHQTELVLMIGMTDSDGLQAPVYAPEREVGAGLHRWLKQAIKGGRLRQGGMLLRTGTRKLEEPRRPVVQLFFDIEDAELAYQPGWPSLEQADVFLMVRDAGLLVNVGQAKLLDSKVSSGWAYLAPGSRDLQVETQLSGPVEDVNHLLKQTPLADLLGAGIQPWQLSDGQSDIRLGLTIPLHEGDRPDVRVSAHLEATRLASDSIGIVVTEVQGELQYSTAEGLTAEGLNGVFLQQPVSAQIESTAEGHQRLHLLGQTQMSALQEWLGWSALSVAQGEVKWQAELDICGADSCSGLHLTSDLQGVELDLPGRLAKTAERPAPLALDFALMPAFSLREGRLLLPVEAQEQSLAVDMKGGAAQRVDIELSHPMTQGVIEIVRNQPIHVALEHLQLDLLRTPDGANSVAEVEADTAGLEREDEYAVALDASKVPAIDFSIDHMDLGEKPLGDWRFKLRPQAEGLSVTELEAHLEQVVLSGELHWLQQQAQPVSSLQLQMAAGDLGRLLQQWGFGRVIESRDVKGSLALSWPGAPWSFKLGKLDGDFRFETGQSRLIETAETSNLLRVFGILNFNSLARRLRLDFSDLLQKGVSFDRIQGAYSIQDGVAQTEMPLTLQGPSANMSLSGQIDLGREQLDQSVEVALPLSSNAPFAAILLGAPQVAGAAFVIDKLIGDQLQRFTSLRYTLKGHWDDPEFKLQPSVPAL